MNNTQSMQLLLTWYRPPQGLGQAARGGIEVKLPDRQIQKIVYHKHLLHKNLLQLIQTWNGPPQDLGRADQVDQGQYQI